MFAFRVAGTGLYARQVGPSQIFDAHIGDAGVLFVGDLWAATQLESQFQAQMKAKHLPQSVEIVELELREVRVVSPLLDINEADGQKLSKLD